MLFRYLLPPLSALLLAGLADAQTCGTPHGVQNLGGGSSGAAGEPQLVLTAAPIVNMPFAMQVQSGPAGSLGLLVASLVDVALFVPAYGATLHPQLTDFQVPVILDGTGTSPLLLEFDSLDPAFCGFTLILQSGLLDPSGPGGAVFTDGLAVTFGDVDTTVPPLGSPVPSAPVLDPFPSSTASGSILLTGASPGAATVEVQGPMGLVQAPVVGGGFSALVFLEADRANDLFFTSVSPLGARSAPTTARVTRDGMPPQLFIDLPTDGATFLDSTVDVVGRVGDLLSGFQGLQVEVNGVAAAVDVGIGPNGTFFASSVPLNPGGSTSLVVTATDALGNVSTESVDVRQVVPTGPSLRAFSGGGQTATVGTELASPIAVQVLQADGVTPYTGKLVTFDVTRSDGGLATTSGGASALTAQVHTDAQGLASVWWTLGSDAGCGNNRVRASSVDVAGSAYFSSLARAQPEAQINLGAGDGQSGEVSAPLPQPLRVWVSDGLNGTPAVPVTFTVTEGTGTIGGQPFVTVPTDVTGHVEVTWDLGREAGIQRVEATYPGWTGPPVTFTARASERDETVPTSFVGIVLDNANRAVGGAPCSLEVAGLQFSTTSAADGTFSFPDTLISGPAKVSVDGANATTLDGVPILPGSFPSLAFHLVLVPNVENRLPAPVLLPALDPDNARSYSTSASTVLTIDGIEGFEMVIAPGSMTIGGVPAPDGTVVALNQVHNDDIPMPPPDGVLAPIAWTLQPAGAQFDPPVQVTMPNVGALPPGAVCYFLSFSHDTERFEIVASGAVTPDGSQVVSDPGAGITVAGWGSLCPPYGTFGLVDNSCDPVTAGAVAAEMKKSWDESSPGEGCCTPDRKEQGGWIKKSGTTYSVERFPPGQCSSIVISLPVPADTIAYWHTHPNTGYNPCTTSSWDSEPSPEDAQVTTTLGLPGYVISADGTFIIDAMTGDTENSIGLDALCGKQQTSDGSSPPALDVHAISSSASIKILNATTFPDSLGSFRFGSVLASNNPVRVTVVDESQAPPLYGESPYFQVFADQTVELGTIELTPTAPLTTVELEVTTGAVTLTSVGQAFQLAVEGTLSDGSVVDATTFDQGTGYGTSNPGVVTVDQDGLLVAVGSGAAFVSVLNEGAVAVTGVVVALGDPLTTIEGFVQDEGGSPVPGAAVSLSLVGQSATTDAAGFFSIAGVPTQLGPLDLSVQGTVGGKFLTGSIEDLKLEAGGITDAGIFVLTEAVAWISPFDGSWSDGANWSTGAPPASGDDVVIDRPEAVTVTLDAGVHAIESLRCDDALVLTGAELQVLGTTWITGALTVDLGGTLRGGTLEVDGAVTLDGGTLADLHVVPGLPGASIQATNSDGTLEDVILDADMNFSAGADVVVIGDLELNSIATLNAGIGSTGLGFLDGTLDGTGDVFFATVFNNRVRATAGTLTIGPGITVRGASGRIGDVNNGLVVQGRIVNDLFGIMTVTGNGWTNAAGATIDVGPNATNLEGSWSNSGTITVNGGTLRLDGSYTTSSVGLVTGTGSVEIGGTADNTGTTWTLDGSPGIEYELYVGTIVGGVVATSPDAELTLGVNGVLDDVTLASDVTVVSDTTIVGDLTVDAQVSIEGVASGFTFATGTLDGTGDVVFNNTVQNHVRSSGGTLTIAPGVTIRGRWGVVGQAAEGLVNQGLIVSDMPGTITVKGTSWSNMATIDAGANEITLDGTWSNAGSLTVVGGTLRLDGAYTPADVGSLTGSGTVELGGTLDNIGGTWTLDGSIGLSWEVDTGTVVGGTLATSGGATLTLGQSAVLDGVTLDTDVAVVRDVDIVGDLVLNGTATISGVATGLTFARGTLDGTGDVYLNVTSSNHVWSEGGPLTIGANMTVHGEAGIIGKTSELLVNDGVIASDFLGTLDVRGLGWVNNGTIAASGGDIDLDGSWTNAGTVTVATARELSSSDVYVQTSGTTQLAGGTLTAPAGVDLQGGVLEGSGTVDGSLSNAATVRPGLPVGVLSVTGDYTQLTGATLEIDVNGTGVGTGYDQLVALGMAALDGTLLVSTGFSPTGGTAFQVLTYPAGSGTFATLDFGTGPAYVTTYGPPALTLTTP